VDDGGRVHILARTGHRLTSAIDAGGMRAAPAVADHRFGVFTHLEALAAGWTLSALKWSVRRGHLNRLRPGVYRVAGPPPDDPFAARRTLLAASATATVLANPSSVASHGAAAVLHGLPLWHLPRLPCVTVRPAFVGDIADAHLHRASLPAGHVTAARAVPATSVGRTVIDLGREHGLISAVVAADSALHRNLIRPDELRGHLAGCRGWPGVRAARAAVDLADGRSESPLESGSRVKLHGLVPEPQLQAVIFGPDGVFIGRTDFLWEQFGVVGEADGLTKYDDIERLSLRAEKLRQELLERTGLIVVRWGPEDLADIDRLVRRLWDAFERGRIRVGAPRCQIVRTPRAA
jgi:hypothetical protein